MNTSLLRYELGRRAERGEIGVRFQRNTWGRGWWVVWLNVLNLCFLSWSYVFRDWVAEPSTTVAGAGRVLYIIAIGVGLWGALVWPGLMLTRRYIHRTERETLDPLSFVSSGVGGIVTHLVLIELGPVLSRILVAIPLLAFVAFAGGIEWSDGALISGFLLALGITQILLTLALSLIMPNVLAVHLALPLIWAPWLYTQVGQSGLVLETLATVAPALFAQLAVICALSAALAYLVLATRTSHLHVHWPFQRRRRKPIDTGPRAPLSRLLCRAIRGQMGVWGTPAALLLIAAAGIAVGMIPIFGGFILLFPIIEATCYFLVLLRRSGWWDELWLTSLDSDAWRTGVAEAFFRLLLPVVPGIVVFLVSGQTGFTESLSTQYDVILDATGNIGASIVGVVILAGAAVLFALVFVFSVSIIAACGFLVQIIDSPGGYAVTQPMAPLPITLFSTMFVLVVSEVFGIGELTMPIFFYGVLAMVIAFFAWLCYHHLLSLLPLASSAEIAVFENTLENINKVKKAQSHKAARSV